MRIQVWSSWLRFFIHRHFNLGFGEGVQQTRAAPRKIENSGKIKKQKIKSGVLRTRWVCIAALPDGGSTCAERGARQGAPARIETEGSITEQRVAVKGKIVKQMLMSEFEGGHKAEQSTVNSEQLYSATRMFHVGIA